TCSSHQFSSLTSEAWHAYFPKGADPRTLNAPRTSPHRPPHHLGDALPRLLRRLDERIRRRPQPALVVERRAGARPEGRVAFLVLLAAAEEHHDLAVPGVAGLAVEQFRREVGCGFR